MQMMLFAVALALGLWASAGATPLVAFVPPSAPRTKAGTNTASQPVRNVNPSVAEKGL